MNTRTMIIIWSWVSRGLGPGIWSVAGKSPAAGQVICRDIQATSPGLDILRALIRTHQVDGEVMVFLHRQHGYHEKHVEILLGEGHTSNSLRCFLFGEGVGPIYLTQAPRGLLGTAGTFSARLTLAEQEVALSAVADYEHRQLKSTHFDFVWKRYQAALYERTAELKEDLFSTLSQAVTSHD